MKTINIKVPNWFPTGYQFREWKRKLTYILFPPRCEDCKIRVKAKRFYYKQCRTGTHPLGYKNSFNEFAIESNRTLCPSCMKKYLLPTEIGKCTICEAENVPVIGYSYTKTPYHVITYLWHWWNGSQFCMQCIDELLQKGEWASDIYEKGKPKFY